MSKYIPPQKVTSPQRRWSLIKVLFDPKAAGDCVLALGNWDNSPVLAMRWNGGDENPIGNPQSRGLPTWFIVHKRYYNALLNTLLPETQAFARNILDPTDL